MDMGKWKGLFEWSMLHQDGTHASEGVKELTPEKKKWLDEALSEFMKDFADRMKEIKDALSSDTAASSQQEATGAAATTGGPSAPKSPLSLSEKEALCDELMELVESLDHARDLHKIGGLPTLLHLMSSEHPSLRWRAAEISATCMANNPPVQRWFIEGGALSPLLHLLSDPDVVVQTKAVLALSALMRHYQPGLEAFRLAGGLQKLLALLGCPTDTEVPPAVLVEPAAAPGASVQQLQQAAAAAGDSDVEQQQQQGQRRRLERKVLALLQYMLLKHAADCAAAAEFGASGPLVQMLADADSDMRQAALAALLELASQPQGWQCVKQQQPHLVPRLQQLLAQHKQLPADEAEAEAEEGDLLQRLIVLLQSPTPPAGGAGGLQDHIELDPYLDGGERSEKTLHIREQQQQQQQQPDNPTGSGMALMAVQKPELR